MALVPVLRVGAVVALANGTEVAVGSVTGVLAETSSINQTSTVYTSGQTVPVATATVS